MSLDYSDNLLAISPIDGRYAKKTHVLQNYFSEYALFKFRFIVEVRWLDYLFTHHAMPGIQAPSDAASQLLHNKIAQFNLADAQAIKAIEAHCQHDVKAVEYFLKNYLSQHEELTVYQEWVHFGCTSEDINNLAYGLMLQQCLKEIIFPKLNQLLAQLKNNAHSMAAIPMLGRTHGQPATPTTLGKEFANFAYRLARQMDGLQALPILGKWNGAVGNYNAHKISLPHIDWPTFNQTFVETLGLTWNPYTTQIEPHDYLSDILAKLTTLHNILIDCARDCWGYISIGYFNQINQTEAVGSSTMPHKINPIDFENAEGNLQLAQAIAQFLSTRLPVSRYQRDLVDSTLMRNLGTIFAYALIGYDSLSTGLNKITANQTVLANDLNNHVEVLAEAIQTIMRVHHLPMPYEQLKNLTRGQHVDLATLHTFINTLALPPLIKQQLLALKPADYLGYAQQLAESI